LVVRAFPISLFFVLLGHKIVQVKRRKSLTVLIIHTVLAGFGEMLWHDERRSGARRGGEVSAAKKLLKMTWVKWTVG
jgi:hypothetical protein